MNCKTVILYKNHIYLRKPLLSFKQFFFFFHCRLSYFYTLNVTILKAFLNIVASLIWLNFHILNKVHHGIENGDELSALKCSQMIEILPGRMIE